MAVEALQCKECRAEYELESRYVCDSCFGPLEVRYDLSGIDAASAKRRIQAGPPTIWRYSDFLPFEAPPRSALQRSG
jgi:threonine synthase